MDTKFYNHSLLSLLSVILCLLIVSCTSKGNSSEKTEEIDEGIRVVDGRLVNGHGEEIYGKHDNYTFGYKGDYILVSDYKYNSDYDRTDTLNGILSATGEEILPCKYDFYTYSNGYIRLYDPIGRKEGMMTPNLKIIVPCKYSEAIIKSDDYIECITIREGKRYGKLDMDGNVLVPCEYNFIVLRNNEEFDGFFLKAGYAYVLSDHGRGLYSMKEHKEVVPPKFRLDETYEEFIGVRKGENFGIYSYSGVEVVPCRYKFIMLVGNYFYASTESDFYDSLSDSYNMTEFDVFIDDGEFDRTQHIGGSELASLCRRSKKSWYKKWSEYY